MRILEHMQLLLKDRILKQGVGSFFYQTGNSRAVRAKDQDVLSRAILPASINSFKQALLAAAYSDSCAADSNKQPKRRI